MSIIEKNLYAMCHNECSDCGIVVKQHKNEEADNVVLRVDHWTGGGDTDFAAPVDR